MDILGILTGRILFNFVGGTVRWIYGTSWRIIANKNKFKFSEYLNGPENADDWFDFTGHKFVNRIIGFITIVGLVTLIIKLGW